MCGIAGLVAWEPLSDEHRRLVANMNGAMVHRGPDGTGEYHAKHVALAMCRLGIIDLASGGQPLYNEDNSLALVANAEIYNFIELRADLRARGHRFKTGSDCEVIVHLYEEYGPDCVHQLRGMFAFALWDSRRQRLVLARDRMGEKPLYLWEQAGQLTFASELKALLRCGVVPFELEPASVDRYFHYQYVPEPATPIKGVRKLAAAHLLTVSLDPWQAKETCYWRMEDAAPVYGEPGKIIRDELESISRIIIRSDVPVGLALSGGLDSSAIAALVSRTYPGTMHAFSVGYAGRPPCDERAGAKALADHLGMPFHEVELDTAGMVECFPELIYWRDDPIADISGCGYYAVMKLAREHGVKVMLQGQGGDELFWGYPWVRQAVEQSLRKSLSGADGPPRLADYVNVRMPRRWSPGWLWGAVRSVPRRVRSMWREYRRDRTAPRERLVFYDLSPDFQAACQGLGSLYAPEFRERLDGTGPYDPFTIPQPWPQLEILMTRLICGTYLLGNGITQGDRLSMASSVELRLPFVDYRLVENVIGLRKAVSDHRLEPKAWLKAALKGLLPDWVMNRPKQGFAPPVHAWHRALFSAYGPTLVDGYLVQAGILSADAARRLARGPFPPNVIAPLSFKALVLELWCRQFSPGLQSSPAPWTGIQRKSTADVH